MTATISAAPHIPPTPLGAGRTQALELTGWGLKPRILQPRNLAFWVFLIVVAAGALEQIGSLSNAAHAYQSVIIFSVVVFALYGALFWWFTHRMDRYAGLPLALVVAAFLWGGLGATWPMAAPANDAIRSLYAKAFGQSWALNWSAGLTAPFTEEIAKGLGLVLLLTLAPRIVRTAFDGFIAGAFIGLGFQLFEDVSYSLNTATGAFANDPLHASVSTTVLRMVTGVSGHILYSSIFCAGLIYLIGTPAQRRRTWLGVSLMVTAMALHGIWDSVSALSASSSAPTIVFLVGTIALSLFIVVLVFRLTVADERRYMRDVMAPEVEYGVITAAELDALSGNGRARKRYFKAGKHGHERRMAKRMFEASGDLAEALARSHGAETDRVAFIRTEITRLRGVG